MQTHASEKQTNKKDVKSFPMRLIFYHNLADLVNAGRGFAVVGHSAPRSGGE